MLNLEIKVSPGCEGLNTLKNVDIIFYVRGYHRRCINGEVKLLELTGALILAGTCKLKTEGTVTKTDTDAISARNRKFSGKGK